MVPNRQKEDKVFKDACDIYALLWHSPEGLDDIIRKVKEEYPKECSSAWGAISEEVASRAAFHLGVEVEIYRDVMSKLRI